MAPGGHQEYGENPYDTAIREVIEETGIDLIPYMQKPLVVDVQAKSLPLPTYIFEEKIELPDHPVHYHVDSIFVVGLPKEIPSSLATWYTLEETEALTMFENVRMVVQYVLKEKDTPD